MNRALSGTTGPRLSSALPPELLRVAIVTCFGSILSTLSATTVNVAMDGFMHAFHAPLGQVQWVSTAYLLALTLSLPLTRWATESFGSKRVYLVSLLGFVAASGLCACAWSLPSLIGFRILQGAAGGLLAPLSQILLAQLAGPVHLARVMGVVAVPIMLAPMLGPAVGGFIMETGAWRGLFLLNLPIGCAGLWAAWHFLPASAPMRRTQLDRIGLLLLSPGLALLLIGVVEISRSGALQLEVGTLPLGLGLGLLGAFVVHARRSPATALLDLRPLTDSRTFAAAAGVGFFAALGTFSIQLLLPLYCQQVRGLSSAQAGLLMIPQGLGMMLVLPQMGRLTDRFDSGALVISGVCLSLVGTWPLSLAGPDTPWEQLAGALFLRGMGLATVTTPAMAVAYRRLERAAIANASTTLSILQRLGAPLGTAVTAAVLHQRSDMWAATLPVDASLVARQAALGRAFDTTFMLGLVLTALPITAAWALVRRNRPSGPTMPTEVAVTASAHATAPLAPTGAAHRDATRAAPMAVGHGPSYSSSQRPLAP